MATVEVSEIDFIQSGVQAVWFSATLFIMVYVLMNRRWWKNIWAQMIVSLDACLWLVDLPNCLRLWFHFSITSSWFAWYSGVTLWVTALVITWRAAMIIYIQLTRKTRTERLELGVTHGEVSESKLERAGTQYGAGWDDRPSTVRPPYPGGDGERD
jgi:hypothetical protein